MAVLGILEEALPKAVSYTVPWIDSRTTAEMGFSFHVVWQENSWTQPKDSIPIGCDPKRGTAKVPRRAWEQSAVAWEQDGNTKANHKVLNRSLGESGA